ncbi:MAG: [LysW]-lysine hydrolase [Anaerolineae bacterium]|nr:[LysW]-lysine hydrolase [Anaerolineae bacterium]
MYNEETLLTGLVERYSPTGAEAEAAAFLVQVMEEWGFSAYMDEVGNAVGMLGDGEREILLLGHIDTVPGQIPVRRSGDVLHGRGAVDAKGALACFAAAAAQAGARRGWRLTVVGAVGEEGDSRGAKHLLQTHTPPQMVIIGEPSGWDRVTLGYKGGMWFEYTVRQPLAHTASQQASACEQAVDFWMRLSKAADDYNKGRKKLFTHLNPSLRGMFSEDDGLYETARLRISLRLPQDLPPSEAQEFVRNLSNGGSFQFEEGVPAWNDSKNTPLVRALLAGVRAQGGIPCFSFKTGTSDMNLVAPVWKCPAVAYGPGDSNLDHTPHEHVLISEYKACIAVLAQALTQLTET